MGQVYDDGPGANINDVVEDEARGISLVCDLRPHVVQNVFP